jgi:PBP1b-binding outer membrane lipoprotein LpoB
MKKIFSLLTVLMFAMLVSSCASLMQEFEGKKDVAESLRGLVTKASQFMSANGQKATFAQINDPQGSLTDNNLFVFVIDTKQNGKIVASADKSLDKVNNNTKDEAGKLFIKEITKIANSSKNKDGYMFYKWNKQAKSSYFQKVGTLILVGSD